jgi:hypothetical protein
MAGVIAAVAAIVRPEIAGLAAIVAGGLLIVFELVEVWVVGFAIAEYGAGEPVAWLQVVYLVLGLLLVGTGARLWMTTRLDRERRERTRRHPAAVRP